MSEQDDALRAMAANRGCKLVKSRRRKPGGDFGRYGLKDAKTGKELLGFGPKGLTATPEEIEDYLRGDASSSWAGSLRTAGAAATSAPPRRRREAKPSSAARKRAWQPSSAPSTAEKSKARKVKPKAPEAPKPPRIREAKPADAEAISKLLKQLGYDVTAADVRRRTAALRKGGEPTLVADRGGVIGCLTWHVTPVIHRPRPVGRITMLVIAEAERGNGIGGLLVGETETRLRKLGCGLVEVTSNMKRMRAHAFYERLGYERTSYRFAKKLQD